MISMLKYIRLTVDELTRFATDTATADELFRHQELVKGMAAKTCGFCHGFGHSKPRCTTRRQLCRISNDTNLRSVNGYVLGLISQDEMTLGAKRTLESRTSLENERRAIRNDPQKK